MHDAWRCRQRAAVAARRMLRSLCCCEARSAAGGRGTPLARAHSTSRQANTAMRRPGAASAAASWRPSALNASAVVARQPAGAPRTAAGAPRSARPRTCSRAWPRPRGRQRVACGAEGARGGRPRGRHLLGVGQQAVLGADGVAGEAGAVARQEPLRRAPRQARRGSTRGPASCQGGHLAAGVWVVDDDAVAGLVDEAVLWGAV